MSQPNPSLGRLSKLPPELRLKIYHHLSPSTINLTPQLTPNLGSFADHSPPFPPSTSKDFSRLRLTSKQLNSEVANEYFTASTFIIYGRSWCYHTCTKARERDVFLALSRFEENIHPDNLARIKRLELRIHTEDILVRNDFLPAVLERIIRLELVGLEDLKIVPTTKLCTESLENKCRLGFVCSREEYYKDMKALVGRIDRVVEKYPGLKRLVLGGFVGEDGRLVLGPWEGGEEEWSGVGLDGMKFGLWDGLLVEVAERWERRGLVVKVLE